MTGIIRASRAGAVAGIWLGATLAVATAAANGFSGFLDVLRLHLALGATFALLLGLGGLAAGVVASPLRPWRERAGPAGLAAGVAATAWVLAARWFELRMAYPARFDSVRDHGDMLGLAAAFLAAAGAGAIVLGAVVLRAAAMLRARGFTARRCAVGAGAAMVGSAVVLAVLPGPSVIGGRAVPEPIAVHGSAFGTRGAPPSAHDLAVAGIVPRPDAKVLLVGCDGADWTVIDALIAEGELPNLQALIRDGVRAPLRTIVDRPSPALWTSLATSRAPEDTGIRDFYVQRVLGGSPVEEFPALFGLNRGLLLRDVLGGAVVKVLPVNATMVRARPVWSVLAEAGVSTGVVNWLVTWPADADGAAFLVSDRAWTEMRAVRGAGDDGGTVPVAENVDRLWDPPGAGAFLPVSAAAWETEDAFAAETALRLYEEHRPQVLFTYFRDVDAAEHLRWNEWEPEMFPRATGRPPRSGPVRESYVHFDAALGGLRAAMGEEATVIVVSDHGHRAWFTWMGRGTPGGHTDSPDGVFLAAGPGIRRGTAPEDPSLYDVAPTVLRLVGLPTAADMEGRPLREILADPAPLPVVASWEVGRGGADPIAEEDEEVIERLRALGYVR